MRNRLTAGLAALLLLAPALAAAQADNRPGIAVFPFTNGGWYGEGREDLTQLSDGVQMLMLHELAQNPALRVVERAQLQRYLAEQNLGEEGRIEPGTAARIGRLVGARYSVTGAFINLYGDFRVVSEIVDVETSEIVKPGDVRGRFDNLYELLGELADRITADVNLPPLPEAVKEAREGQAMPPAAIIRLGAARRAAELGDKEQAVELLRQLASDFPRVTAVQEQLRQLGGT